MKIIRYNLYWRSLQYHFLKNVNWKEVDKKLRLNGLNGTASSFRTKPRAKYWARRIHWSLHRGSWGKDRHIESRRNVVSSRERTQCSSRICHVNRNKEGGNLSSKFVIKYCDIDYLREFARRARFQAKLVQRVFARGCLVDGARAWVQFQQHRS